MKAALIRKQLQRGFTLIELMVVIAILASLAAIGYGPILDQLNAGDRATASQNLKTLHTSLNEFKNDNSTYPSDSTAEMLLEKNPEYNYGALTGDYSNCYYRQLFYGKTNLEKPFYAKIVVDGYATIDPDDSYTKGDALTKKECGLSYVLKTNSDDEKIAVSETNEPLALSSVYPANKPYRGRALRMDTKSFRGSIFILKVDGSVTDSSKIFVDDETDDNSDNKAKLADDKNIFPSNKRGKDLSDRYLVLPPEL